MIPRHVQPRQRTDRPTDTHITAVVPTRSAVLRGITAAVPLPLIIAGCFFGGGCCVFAAGVQAVEHAVGARVIVAVKAGTFAAPFRRIDAQGRQEGMRGVAGEGERHQGSEGRRITSAWAENRDLVYRTVPPRQSCRNVVVRPLNQGIVLFRSVVWRGSALSTFVALQLPVRLLNSRRSKHHSVLSLTFRSDPMVRSTQAHKRRPRDTHFSSQ